MYTKLRKFNSDIHVYTFDPQKQKCHISKGLPNTLEPLSKIVPGAACKINAAFFDSSAKDGYNYSKAFMPVCLNKDYKLTINNPQPGDIWQLGGSFPLVMAGQINIINKTPFPHWKDSAPRTAIGQKADGKIVFVVVDGRSFISKGVNADELASIVYGLGCIDSMNLDGGGSSEMIVDGKIVNKPSDGHERPIASALIVDKEVNMDIIIALDDGHGMETAGKRTPTFPDGTFMHENEFNRAVVALLDKGLQDCGFKTLLVSEGDTDIALSTRTQLANNEIKNKYDRAVDFFLSIHANAMGEDCKWNPAEGISTHIYGLGGEAEKAAKIIYPLLMQGTAMKDRGIVVSNFHVLRETDMPAILFELAFMTNEKEARLLLTGAYRLECANEILKGMCQYYGKPYKPIIEQIDYKAKYDELVSKIEKFINEYKGA